MRISQYEQGYPQGNILNDEARAVIEAEFEEITVANQSRSFTQRMKDVFQWIKRRLQRT